MKWNVSPIDRVEAFGNRRPLAADMVSHLVTDVAVSQNTSLNQHKPTKSTQDKLDGPNRSAPGDP